LALSEPLLSTTLNAAPAGNAGLLRKASRLLVIIVSDEDDCSDPTGKALAIESVCRVGECTQDAECGGEGHYCLPERSGFGCGANACEIPGKEGRDRLAPTSEFVQFFQNLDDGTGRKREVFLAVVGAVDASLNPARCKEEGGTGDDAYGVAFRYKQAIGAMGSNGLIQSICASDYGPALKRIADLVSAPQRLEIEDGPADGHLLQVEVTRTSGTTQRCLFGSGFDFDAATSSRKASITLKGDCLLKNGDNIGIKLICAS